MKGPRSGGPKRLGWTIGLGLGLLAAVLWWADGQRTAVQALGRQSRLFARGPITGLREGTVGPAWDSTQPVSRRIISTEMSTELVWAIPQYGVTVTFPAGWLGPLPPDTVVITFTPELSAPLPAPVYATSYFYDLRGQYDPGGEISLSKAITVEVKYDLPGLGPIVENSLRAFYYSQSRWVPTETRNGFSHVDPVGDVFQLTGKFLGHVGVGGYRSQAFLPLVLRSASKASSLTEEVLQP